MEEFKKRSALETKDKEIVFSKSIKAGKRIYYLDVKKNRNDEMFLAITESKKVVSGEGEDPQISFEKHKIFLYKEDFDKFMTGLEQAIEFINESQDNGGQDKCKSETAGTSAPFSEEIKIDIDF